MPKLRQVLCLVLLVSLFTGCGDEVEFAETTTPAVSDGHLAPYGYSSIYGRWRVTEENRIKNEKTEIVLRVVETGLAARVTCSRSLSQYSASLEVFVPASIYPDRIETAEEVNETVHAEGIWCQISLPKGIIKYSITKGSSWNDNYLYLESEDLKFWKLRRSHR